MRNSLFFVLSLISLYVSENIFAMTDVEKQQYFDNIKKELDLPPCLDPILQNYVKNNSFININEFSKKVICSTEKILNVLNKIDKNQTDFTKHPFTSTDFVIAMQNSLFWIIPSKTFESILQAINEGKIENDTIRKNIQLHETLHKRAKDKSLKQGKSFPGMQFKTGTETRDRKLEQNPEQAIELNNTIKKQEELLQKLLLIGLKIEEREREREKIKKELILTKIYRVNTNKNLSRKDEKMHKIVQDKIKTNKKKLNLFKAYGVIGIGISVVFLIVRRKQVAEFLHHITQKWQEITQKNGK